jgi:glutathione S-transferase
MPAIVLHQWSISPFCRKIRSILEHKGLAFETIDYNGLKARKAAGLSGPGKLPVLDYDGERVQDSSDIAVFLETKHPEKPVFPRDPVARASAAIWEDWADESLYWFEVYFRFMYDDARAKSAALLSEGRSGFERVMLTMAVKRMYGKKLVAQGLGRMPRERVEQKFVEHVDTLETLLGSRPWLVGDGRTIADIAVASQLHEIVRTSHMASEVNKRTHVTEWLARN